MPNAYCDLATLKSGGALNITGSAYDSRLLALLEEASRRIDGYCNRHFYVLHTTRRFDVNWEINWPAGGGMQLLVPDLIGVERVSAGNPGPGPGLGIDWAWAAGDYRLYPLDAAPTQPWGRPYTRLAVSHNASAGRCFPAGPATVEITGRWGFREVKADSGTAIKDGADLEALDTRLTLVEGGILSAGQTLSIGAEQLYVVAVDGEDVTVERGVNGTDAAGHPAGSAIAVYRYPGPVTEACLQLVSQLWHSRDNLAVPSGAGQREPHALSGAGPVVGLLAAYRKLPVG